MHAYHNSPHHIDYKMRLITLDLLATSYRREIMDITLFLEVINHQTNLDNSKYMDVQG